MACPLLLPPPLCICRQPPTNLVCAVFDTDIITDLAVKAKLGATFHLGFTLPQGESPANLGRVNTKSICTPVIINKFTLLAFCSNIITTLLTLEKFTTTSLNPDEAPLLAQCDRAFGAVIMSGGFKEYCARYTRLPILYLKHPQQDLGHGSQGTTQLKSYQSRFRHQLQH